MCTKFAMQAESEDKDDELFEKADGGTLSTEGEQLFTRATTVNTISIH